MELEKIKNVAIIGGGTMGSQLAELFSTVGKYSVVMWSRREETVKSGLGGIEGRLKKFFVDKGKMSQGEMAEILGRIKGTTNISEAARHADFVLESVAENLVVKKEVFKQLDENAPASTILATNSSQLNITDIASVTRTPDKVVGMHFFNPVGVMKLVEVARGTLTSEETVELVCALSRKLGKEPVVCKDFSYGFIANRAYRALRWEIMQMILERVASPEDIDKALKLGFNLPMGPLELGDFSGAWKTYAVSEADAIREMGPEKGSLHPLIKMMMRAGYTGGQGKKGIYAFWKEVMSKW